MSVCVEGQLALEWDSTAWRKRADAALDSLAASGHQFTAYDIARIAGDPESYRSWGALMSAARQAGRIVAVGFANGDRPTVRGSAVRVWRGAGALTPTT